MTDLFDDEKLKYCDHPSDLWDGRVVRAQLFQDTAEWIYSLRPWSTFVTLTFKDEKPPDVANRLFKKLISVLNENTFGKKYTRKVGHSYFSYVQGIEYQKRDVIHFHMLIDRPVDFLRIHLFWNAWAGFVWTDVILDREKVVNYVSKYISKGGEINVYLAKKKCVPHQKPHWWNEDFEHLEPSG
jgi:hypothetical protein